MPLVSIILPYYRKINYIKKTINSILNQSFKDFEIILVYDDEDLQDLYINTLSFISKKEYKKLIMLKEYKKYINEKKIRLTIGNLHKDLYFHFLNKIKKEISFINLDVVNPCQKKIILLSQIITN